MGSSKKKTVSSSTTRPLDWQENDIKNIFQKANDLYNDQSSQAAPNFDTFQGLNQTQQNALGSMVGNSMGQNAAGNNLLQQGQNMMGFGQNAMGSLTQGQGVLGQYSGNAANGAAGNFDKGNTSVSNILTGMAGNSAGQSSDALQRAIQLASTNATQQNAQDASDYANSSGVQNAIKNTIDQSNSLYQRTTLPSLNAQAQAGGNLNSSRAGAAQAMSDDLQEQRNASTASSMWNNAYSQGLQTAESARQSNLSGLLSGASTGQSGLNLALQGQNAANDQTNANNANQLNWNSQLGNAGNSLVNAGQAGASIAGQGADITSKGQDISDQANKSALTAGTVQQTNDQSSADADLQNQLQQKQYYWSLLQQLYGIQGANNWGQQTNSRSVETSTPSVGQMVQGALGTVAGMAGSFMTGGASSLLGGLMGGGGGAKSG